MGVLEVVLGSSPLYQDNIQFRSGTAYAMTFDHAITAARTITFPDVTDTVAVLGTAQDWTTLQTFKAGLVVHPTPAVTAANQSLNPAPTALALTAANTKSFTAIAQNITLPSITPAANGAGITLTGLNLSQGAISNVADSEAITVKQLVITGAAGVALETGAYVWTGADITMPAQAANAATNLAKGIKITGGTKAGGASATQIGVDITMAATTDSAITVNTGACSFKAITLGGTVTGGSQVINSLGHIGIGADSTSTRNIYINESYASTGSVYTTIVYPTATLAQTSAAYTAQFTGVRAEIGVAAGNTQNWSHATAGLIAQFGYVYTVAGSAGTVTGACSFMAAAPDFANAATVTNYYGLYVANPTVAGAKLTNAYGIYLEAITSAATLNYALYSAGGLIYSASGIQCVTTPAVSANSQTLNAAPSATTVTAVNVKSFTATGANIVLPAITPAANGSGITLTGLALSQGAIGNVADTETITVTQLAITGAAGVANETGVYTWTGISITTPAQAANAAVNAAVGLKVTCGAVAGAATAYQRGVEVTMAVNTQAGLVVLTGTASIGVAPYAALPASSLGVAGGVMVGADSTNNLIAAASTGGGSASLYIGNRAILVANGINFGPGAVASITVVNGQITAIS